MREKIDCEGNRSMEKNGLEEKLKHKTITRESALRQRQCHHVQLEEHGWAGGWGFTA